MENPITTLTKQEEAILHSYFTIAEGIAEFFGEYCEVIIHDLSHLDSSVIKICNGYLSGRQEGAPISDVALSLANRMTAGASPRHLTYFAKNNLDESYKATISAIEGDHGRIIGLFCINFYLHITLNSIIRDFTPTENPGKERISENFVEDTQELMLSALESAKKIVYNDHSISSSNKNKEIIFLLYQRGIFNLKDSVISIANHLGISKNTVYMHLRNIPKEKD